MPDATIIGIGQLMDHAPSGGRMIDITGAARIIKMGTLCYVVESCLASPRTQCAVGKIVEVVSLPYGAPEWTYLPGTYYDVRFDDCIFYCRSDKLRPISDPDANITEWKDE